MQTLIDFDNLYEYPPEAVALAWLKNYRWEVLFRWNIDRKIERSSRIVNKAFPNGISQADFMKVVLR